ncbi:MAG: hypothetical protein AB8F65_10865 [Woeseiaceae bacterium]
MPTSALRALTQQLVQRLTNVVDEEEGCHTAVCENMIALVDNDAAIGLGDEAVPKLITSLQYFDRLQQRTHYFAKAIERSLNTDGSAVELHRVIKEYADRAPHQDDANWCLEQATTILEGSSEHDHD